MKERAFILFKKENEKKVLNIIKFENLPELKKKRLNGMLVGFVTPINEDLMIYQFLNIFDDYRTFDNFLIKLVQDFGFHDLNKTALLIGCMDNTGFLWTDYVKFFKEKSINENQLISA